MTSLRFGLLAFALATSTAAHAASFDCSKARSLPERMICGDVRLSEMDDRLAAAYASGLQVSPAPDRLRSEQRQWMAERNRCSNAECVTEAYGRRTAALAAGSSQSAPAQSQRTASCRQSIGPTRASVLVKQCIQVSPATHPPCNDANACDMITDEIQRGCRMYPPPVPAFCRERSVPR